MKVFYLSMYKNSSTRTNSVLKPKDMKVLYSCDGLVSLFAQAGTGREHLKTLLCCSMKPF
jgi:hypothetical protein